MSDKKPWEQFANTQPQDTEQKPWESFSGQTKPKEAERKALSDIGNSIASGAAAAGRGILGLSDLVTGSNSIQNTKNLGLDIKSSEQAWKDNLSEKAKQEEQAWNNTQGFVDTLKYGATHPFAVANKVAESLPAMAVSGGMGGAVAKGVVGGAIGEGMQQAGSSYADAIEKNNGNTPTDKNAAAALGSGVTTGTISALSGGLAKKLGIGDIDTAITNRVAGETATSARPLGLGAYAKNIGKGIVTEGALEELPQSATEQMWQNYPDGNPIMEGVPEAAAQGLITGGLMGGAFNATNLPTFNQSQNDQGNQGGQGQSNSPMPEVLPPDGSNGLPNNAQPNTFDGSYRDLTPTNAPQLTNEPQPEGAPASSNNAPSNEAPIPSGLGLNLLQLNNTTSETPEAQAGNLSPSQELGIDPNQGGLSSAAAVAVDTGASPITAELQRQATQSQPNEQANWLNGIASPTAQSQNEAPQLGYSPSENTNTDTPPAQQAQVADLWNSQEPQQRMAILGGIYGNEDMARQNALASFDRLPKPAQQQIADIAVQNGAINEDSNTQSSNGQTTQTAPQAPLTALAQDIAPTSQANAAPAIEPILGRDGKNKWFATQNKANEFIQKKSLGDNYTIEQTDKMRYEIVPKVQQNNGIESASTPKNREGLLLDYQTHSNAIDKDIESRGLTEQLHSIAGATTERPFSEMSKEKQAKAYADLVESGIKPAHIMETSDEQAARLEQSAAMRRLQATDTITQKNGKPFKQQQAAEKIIQENNLRFTHEVKQVDDGFILKQLSPAAQQEAKNKADGIESYTDIQSRVAKDMGIGTNEYGEYDVSDEQFAEMNKRVDAIQREQRGLKPTQEPQRTQQERRQMVIDAYNTDNNPPADAGNYAQQKAKVTIDRVKQQSPSLYEEARQLAENAEVATNKTNGRTSHYLTFANDDTYQADPFLGKKPSKDEIMVEALMHVTRDNAPMPPTTNNTEATQPKLYGKESYIQTGSERQPTRVAVVEADSLAPDDKNTDNQFRDRTRSASQMQIDSIANNLDPRQLADSTTMATGSPTLANDGKTIIAGNGRTKAIKQAYAQGKGAEYKQSLIEQAQSLGIDPQQIAGMKNPVLVKEFTNPVDVKKMAIESNATGGLAMSVKEQARADSALMPDMSMLVSDDKGNINLSRNAPLFRKFISSLPVEAQASMLDKDGLLSKEGLSRLQNAVLYKAYGDSKAFDDMVENTDVDVKNAINGLTQVAPKIAQTKESINQGTSYDADISDDITAALSLLQQIRKNEMSVSDYLSQMGLFDDGLSPVAKEFIQYIDANIRSAKAIADLLSAYYDNLDSLGNPNQQDLLGGKPNTDKQSLFKQALEQVRNAKQPKQTTNDLFAEPTASDAGQPTNQADNAVEQRPSQSQSDGAGVGTNESAKPSDEQVKTALKELVSDDVWSGKKALIISPSFAQKVADQLGYQGDIQNKADGKMSDFAKQVNDVYGGMIKNQAKPSNQKEKDTPQSSKTEVYADELEKWVANTKSAAEFARSVTGLRDSQLPNGVNVDFYNFIAQAIGAKSPQTIGFRIKLEEYWLAANDTKNNNAQSTNKYEKFQSPIISDDTFENTQQQTNGAKEIKFESDKNYQFEYDVNAALDADGFNQEGDFLRLDYKNKKQPLSAAKSYGARVFFSYNQTTGKVSSIISVYTDSTHKRSIEITNEPNNQYPKVKFETEFYKPLFDVVAKDGRAFQDYIDSGKWQAEKDAKREQIKQNFIDNKPAIFTDLAKKYMSASLVDAAGVKTAEQFRDLSDDVQAEAFAKMVEQTGYTPPRKKAKPTNVKEGIEKARAEKSRPADNNAKTSEAQQGSDSQIESLVLNSNVDDLTADERRAVERYMLGSRYGVEIGVPFAEQFNNFKAWLLDKKQSEPTNTKDAIAKIQAEKKTAKKDKEKFADNKVFTADKVAAARARMKSKLSQINSGIDPEMVMDGITITGAYVESGIRKFGDYANAMIEDFGDSIKPYLLSFWESARHFPGLDTDGMTSVEDSKKEFDALIAKSDNEVNTEQDNTDDNSLRGTPRGRASTTTATGETSQGTLARVPADDVSPVSKTGNTTGQAQPSSRTSVSSDGATGRSGAQSERSAGNRPAAVYPATTRDERVTPEPTQAVTADNTATDYPITPLQNQENSQDFTISEDDEVGKGGLKTKFKQNLEAIKLLKQLQRENRQATKDEQKILTKWVGWGGLKAAFRRGDGSTVNGWAKEVEQLEALLTPDELDAALNSTIAAHYTEPKIVKAMWKAVEKLGFNGGRVLEPSIGSGIFLGMLPASLRKSTAFYGTELDTITGGLAQQLYPTAAIKVMGFQDYSLQDGFFKVAIGNPPFANIKITDLERKHLNGLSLHNYFFAKSLDALEDNGVLAMVVTSRLLDGADPKTRNYLFDNAELLMAVRLPNNAFKENANTDVTTDIIFLRKRSEAERVNGITNDFDYRGVGKFTDKNGDVVPLNNYFVKNPDHMLGEFGNFGTMYARGTDGIETALVAPKGQNTLDLLNKVLDKLPTGVITPRNKSDVLIVESMVKDIPDVKVGSMFEQDGNIYERTPDSMGDRQAVAVELPSQKAIERVKGLIGLRTLLSDVRQMQLSSNTDETVLDQRRDELNKAYDQFVKEHGHINSDANKRLFKEDPSWSQLSALEDNYDKGVSAAVSKNTGEPVKKPSAKKAAILERRTQYPFAEVTQVSSAKDGMIETLNSVGRLDLARISQLYGKDEQAVIKELGDLVYQDPVQGWVTADNYLSGNVKAKLAQAREAMAQYGNDYERNVKALEQVQPEDIEAVDIEVRAGAHWIPANHITDFLKDVLGATGLQGAPTYSKFDNDWTLPKFSESAEASTQFGTSRKSVRDIVTAAMNGKQVTVYDQIDRDTRVVNREATNDANQKVEAVKRAWNDWIWMDDGRRDELARLYNDIFNTDVAQAYDGSHLKLLGKVDDNVIELRPTQKNAIWRITQNPTTLLDHVVGAGKTFTMVAAAMELRRMGLASKPMIVVPNHLVSQWGKEFIQLYPNANILVATKKDFEATNRKRLVARIANGDWDAVIVAHSSFGKIAVSPEFEAEFIKQQIQEISDAIEQAKKEAGKSSNARDLANRKLKLEEKYKKLTASENRDTDNLYWDELGVDALMLDEAHEFKNLAYTTSSMNRVAGLGNQAGSQKAMDLFMKIQQLKQNPSSRIVFATGTPISNSMAEMYTMQRYLDMERMQNQGISGFDAWAKTFGEVINDWELSASGKYQMKSRFAKFVNMPELMQSYLGFADVINRDDINDSLKSQGKKLPVPKIKGGAPQNTVVERSDEQAEFIGVPRIENGREIYGEHTLIYRAEHLPTGQDAKKKGADNMLKIMGEARKAALDMRILDPNAPDFAGSKVNVAVGNIMRIWRDTAADKGTQLVFCDLSTPKGSNNKEQAKLNELVRLADEGNEDAIAQLEKYTPDELDAIMNVNSFSVYDDIKQKLINQGIPENEIAFIHDANTELQKDELFSKVRSGRVRVLLGSTSKMGAGTNVQTRLVALHHLDAPWRPSDLEQREGRIIRQGNELYAKDPENFEVEIHRYATEQTMDAMQWQIIENKAKFIEQVRKGDIKTRVIEDIEGEAANAGAMKAAASGNPLILEEMALKKQLNDLDSDKTRHDREQHRIKATIKRTKDGIDSLDNEQSRYTTLSQAKTPAEFDITVNGKNYKQGQEGARTDAGKAIISQAIKASMSKNKLTVGQYGDFTIYAAANPTNRDSAIISLGYQNESISIEVKHNDPAGGIITKLINRIKEIPDKLQQFKTDLEKSIKAIPKLESQLKPWGKEAELDAIRQKHADVMDALKPKKDGQPQQNQQYSQSGTRIGGTSKQVRQVLSDKFGKAAIDKLIADGNLEIIDFAEAKRRNPKTPSNADGYYADGKAVLIADNLSPDMIIPTFLHELGGHGGLQTLMSDKAYQSLMKEFDRMVSEGNQLAIEAKAFADATSPNAKVAQDEYLPYLISLAAKAQGNSKVKSMLNRIVMAVKSFMRDKFGVSFKITPADIVALAEKMVTERAMQDKSITDNIGTFNPESDDIRYSQMGGNSPQVNKLSKALSEFLKNPLSFIKTASDNKVTDNLGKALALLGRRQLVDIYKKDLPPIKEYSDIVEQMDADSNEKAYEADKLVKEWGKLKDELPLAELMHDATLKGIDPAEAYQTGDDRAIYQQLRRRYDALSPDAKRIYKQARDDYKAQQRSVFEAIKGRIQRTDMSAPRQAELIRKMEQGFFFGQKVYFPLARFGNYVVAVKDAAGNIVSVSRAETQAQANQLRKELIAQYPNDKVGRVMLDKEFVSSRDGVTRGFMSDLFDAVDKLNISSQERAEFEDTLGQLYLNSLPDISFAKSGMHRKGTAGFSQNARRAYAQHMSRGSHYIAKMRHSDVLQAKLDEMQEYVKAQGEADPNYDQPKMQRVVDEMEKRHESLMNNHTAGWSSLATSVGFMWYMGLSPASALVNLSQTALVAYPIMGAKWGFAKASKELLIASGQASKALNNLQSSLSGDEKTAFDEAVKRGVIDMTQAHDLAGVARGEDDSVMWKIRKPMEWASFMFHHAEKFNRQVTFVASYRLAKQSGVNHKQAIEQAIDATYEGHFSYASSNRPRMMQGDWARVFLLFKQYGQNMVYTLTRNAYLSTKGDKQAMKTLAGMLALHGTFAGVLGLPLATTLLGFASALGGDDDEPWDAEIALRNYLAELLGDGASEVISKGLPRALGIDLSSRVGLDSLILPRMQEGLEGQRAGESFTAAMTGPVAGIGVNALAGFSDIQKAVTPNEYLIGTEKLLPKAFRDLIKTYRLAAYGNVDKTGIEIVPQENISLSDVGQQALGFRSGKIAQAQEGKSAIYKMDKEIGSKRQRLMNRYAKAYMAGDAAGAEEAWQDIKRFNAGIGKDYPKLKITKPKLMQSIKQRRRRIEDAKDGIYLPSSREASRQYGSFATD